MTKKKGAGEKTYNLTSGINVAHRGSGRTVTGRDRTVGGGQKKKKPRSKEKKGDLTWHEGAEGSNSIRCRKKKAAAKP